MTTWVQLDSVSVGFIGRHRTITLTLSDSLLLFFSILSSNKKQSVNTMRNTNLKPLFAYLFHTIYRNVYKQQFRRKL